jgi:hypothetical protein
MNKEAAIYIKQLRGGFFGIGTRQFPAHSYSMVSVRVFEKYPDIWKEHTWMAEEYWDDPDKECQMTGQELCREAVKFLGEEDAEWW